MRILANYGCKTNGDSYSVTFETTGDVQIDTAPETVDNLFLLAKAAIQRQIQSNGEHYEEEGVDDFPPKEQQTNYSKGNGKNGGNGGGKSNGNGSSKITKKQMDYIYVLLKENEGLTGNDATSHLKKTFNVQYVREMTNSQADQCIQKLLNG